MKYWHHGSYVWLHYFTHVRYSNGDEVWVSKLTGRGYAGRTHDGYIWNAYNQTPVKETHERS